MKITSKTTRADMAERIKELASENEALRVTRAEMRKAMMARDAAILRLEQAAAELIERQPWGMIAIALATGVVVGYIAGVM